MIQEDEGLETPTTAEEALQLYFDLLEHIDALDTWTQNNYLFSNILHVPSTSPKLGKYDDKAVDCFQYKMTNY